MFLARVQMKQPTFDDLEAQMWQKAEFRLAVILVGNTESQSVSFIIPLGGVVKITWSR